MGTAKEGSMLEDNMEEHQEKRANSGKWLFANELYGNFLVGLN
jgi:hypothetical protein